VEKGTTCFWDLATADASQARRRVLRGGIATLLGVFFPRVLAAAELNSPSTEVNDKFQVYFATNRNLTSSPFFGAQYGNTFSPVSYGRSSTLAEKRTRERTLAPIVETPRVLTRTTFFDEIRNTKKKIVVFVHGYATSWQEALSTAARLKMDIGGRFTFVVFSWTSRDWWPDYVGDQDEADASFDGLLALIRDLSDAVETEINVIVHSMGARVLLGAINSLPKSGEVLPLQKIRNIILAAPDVEQRTMDAIYLPIIGATEISTTIYVSGKDFWMDKSERLHGKPRVGSANIELYVRPGITTIDVTNVDPTLLGHSTIFYSQEIASDLYYLLGKGIIVSERHRLERRKKGKDIYWRIK
jgi:esterase/lipase superfamily enzyme